MTTDYIIPIVEIVGTEMREFILYCMVDRYKILAWECVDRDKARHAYFQGTGKIFVMNCYKFQNPNLHTFANTFFIFFYSGKSNFTELKKNDMHKHNYFNHVDKILDITIKFRKQFLECQTTETFRVGNEDL